MLGMYVMHVMTRWAIRYAIQSKTCWLINAVGLNSAKAQVRERTRMKRNRQSQIHLQHAQERENK